ncbi:MAG: 2Fe-2S iron-sulfur cluster-binding protein [Pseudomonadota bacterium]|jgi:sarcosine oxidase subunit alpha
MNAPRQGARLSATPLRFRFDGRVYTGQVGDTAASALLAAGVRAMGRSVKCRRLRGVMTAGPEEPNALFTVGTAPAVVPNVPATQLKLTDGMVLETQNRWPTLRFDLTSVLQLGSAYFGAGFYYKTFLLPKWHFWEGMIRRLAGLGKAPGRCDLPAPSLEHSHCDVLVAGAGPAGLAAALAAARNGARVVLAEREPLVGGELEFEQAQIQGRTSAAWTAAALLELARLGARVLTDTTLVAGSTGEMVLHTEPAGMPGAARVIKLRPRALVVATGAVERMIAFVDNDRPGVFLLGAAERYWVRYGVAVARRAVLFANHDRVYVAAGRLAAAGITIAAIVDTRASGALSAEAQRVATALMAMGTECLAGSAILAAQGRVRVTGATVASLSAPGARRVIACDALLVSGGWGPAIHAALQEGGSKRYADALGAFVATDAPDWRATAGSADGAMELAGVLHSGVAAGVAAAAHAGHRGAMAATPAASGDPAPQLQPFWRSPADETEEKRQFVDPQNDVSVADLRTTLAEGFIDIEHVKRYTALGFGTDQAKFGGQLGAAIVAQLRNEPVPAVGTTKLRPPFHPVTVRSIIGHRSGARLRPARVTPLHEWHVAQGAVMEAMGLWMRPRYYRANGNNATDAGIVEAGRVRTKGGIVDGSTLGKIEVVGPDAAAFLDHLYLTKASTIKVGRSKYMVNLREDGMVLDDGIVLRLSAERFLLTVSTGHTEHMVSHFEHYRETEWASSALTLTDVTDAWAVIVVAGPECRAVLASLLGNAWAETLARLRHMDFATGQHEEHDLTVLRASFSGELAFELHCRPAIAMALWASLVGAGLAPYGLEALDILRLEKGYLVSSELNGQTTPYDLCMDGMVALGNPCVGRDLLDRPAFHEPHRPRLVGLRATDGHSPFLGGAQLTEDAVTAVPAGYVTSSAYSPALGEWIGLALVSREVAEGGVLYVRDPLRGGDTTVKVVSPVHYDPKSDRMKS